MYRQNLVLERFQRMLLDGAAVFVAALVAVWLRHDLLARFGATSGTTPWSSYLFPAMLVASLAVLVLRICGSYEQPHRKLPLPVTLGAIGAATLGALTLSFFYRSVSYSRATVIIFFPLAAVAVVGVRYAYDRYVRAVRSNDNARRRVLIVGRTPLGNRLSAALRLRPAYYDLVGFLDDDLPPSAGENNELPVLGGVDALARVVDEHDVDEVLISLAGSSERVMDVIGECMRSGVVWKAVPYTYGLRLDRMWMDDFDGIPLVGTRGTRLVGYSWMLKRGFDVAFAGVALVLMSPFLLLIAAAVALTSRGPVFYRQTRIGINGKPFQMLKFRSMRVDGGISLHSDFALEWIHGRTGDADGQGVHKMVHDPRVTRVGRIIRATSLDELPQFWNVLRGDMSVVGPRPPLPYEVERYTEWHRRRLSVPPGITGSWQVSGRNLLSFDEMVALDVAYIENWSFENDVRIVLRTIPAMLMGK